MGTSLPIRSLDELTAFRSYYFNKEVNLRNYMLICMGLNTALRISDMLQLKWGNVYDFDRKHYVKHIVVCEGKTGKETRIAINNNLIEAFEMYMGSLKSVSGNDYIFTGKTKGTHLSRSQAFRIITHVAEALNMENGISCHSLRKTFGYYAWKYGTPPAMLMEIYNHSSYEITKRYLGIKQDDRDNVFLKVNL